LTKGRIAAAHGQFNAFAPPYLISWQSVKALPRYRNFWFSSWWPPAMLNF